MLSRYRSSDDIACESSKRGSETFERGSPKHPPLLAVASPSILVSLWFYQVVDVLINLWELPSDLLAAETK
jgi:hypothetical protein